MMLILRGLRAVNDVVEMIIAVFAGIIMGVMAAIVFGGAVTRYMTGTGYNIVMELPPMLVPWLALPMAGVLIRTDSRVGGHIAVDFLPERLSPNGKRWLRALVGAITLGAAIVFFLGGYEATELFKLMGQRTEMEWSFPIWWLYLSFPVGFAIMSSFALENIITALLGSKARRDKSVEG